MKKEKDKYKNWQLKLITIGSLFSVFLILLVPFFHNFKTETKSVESYVALGSAEEKYYDRLDEVSNEYRNEEKDFSKEVITATFTILKLSIEDFDFGDMTKGRMREVADLMLDQVEHEDGTITFTPKSEDGIKDALPDYFKGIDSSLSEATRKRMAEDVYDYIESYEALINFGQGKDLDPCISTGNTQALIFLDMTTDQYIATMGPIAQADYSRNGIFASVTLAQSIIESGWGKSGLTQKANNMFGIKCSSNWTGECINMTTGEYGTGGYYNTTAAFRKYPSIEDSVNDHSLFLKENSRYSEAGVFDATTYQDQIRAIHNAGYATDPNYASSIISAIQTYNLDKWDVLSNVSSNLCYTGATEWTIRTVAPTANDPAFTVKSDNRGQCVWYVQARVYEVALELAEKGIIESTQADLIRSKIYSVYANAGDWIGASQNIMPTSTNINDLRAGAIIVWTKSGGYGHVAFVEEVTSDSVTITEGWATNTTSCPSNWNCINFNNKTMSIDEFYNSYGPHYTGNYNFSGYVFPLE